MESTELSPESLVHQQVPTELLREKIRNYSRQQRDKLRASELDALRFGLGEIQAKITELYNLTEKDVSGLAVRIKRRKHASVEDMYRLSHAFLQNIENIRAFAKIPGAIQVLVKELTGNDSERQVAAVECLCNLSLGEAPVCEKITSMAGSYLVTYLDSTEERLKRTSLWTLANVLATGLKAAQTLIQMELFPKLWYLYTSDDVGIDVEATDDYREDAAICLQLISLHAHQLLRIQDRALIEEKFYTKNPTCAGAEHHLEIIFNCDIIHPKVVLNEQHLIYLINFALSSLTQNVDNLENAVDRLRIVYALRVLTNLVETQPMAYNLFLSQLSNVWQFNLIQLLNKIFSLRNVFIHKETFWFIRTLMNHETIDSQENLLSKLRIPQVTVSEIEF